MNSHSEPTTSYDTNHWQAEPQPVADPVLDWYTRHDHGD